ncbi:MAG: hypothetical protein BWY09_02688 [Candidatus Hydrogenedentes bacterium ADurb.Bin179]|nr:MAG: hypothetical protein BWY09_02688 [Candidatus Hydrogenedentes bacterium ADurb.Bin179]
MHQFMAQRPRVVGIRHAQPGRLDDNQAVSRLGEPRHLQAREMHRVAVELFGHIHHDDMNRQVTDRKHGTEFLDGLFENGQGTLRGTLLTGGIINSKNTPLQLCSFRVGPGGANTPRPQDKHHNNGQD